jgi:peptide/nickel transport system permease protein
MRLRTWYSKASTGPRPSVIIGLAWLSLITFVVAGAFAPWIAPYGETQQFLSDRLSPPLSEGYLLGTDALGRDLLTRLIYGARISLFIGVVTVLFTAILGVAIGLVSGYVGGKLDSFIMRVVDIWLAFPFLLMAIALVAVLGRGIDKLVLAFVVSGWTQFARPVRGEVLQLREREFTMSAQVLGVSRLAIMFKHLLPNVMPTILVIAALDLGYTILALASLSFLGLGSGPRSPRGGGCWPMVATTWPRHGGSPPSPGWRFSSW